MKYLTDKKMVLNIRQEEISKGKIYAMDKINYNQVLKEGEINGKDINSDQEQR